ncbi:GNAT family N-acetyltransferase [Nocardioides marmoriginsengisoli]|uniref:GNAT family N-acetyltransferase n=1 Tax=Nocardioides marmoriginsengisoli TaxID=661483 RepID=A0A3N0CNU1_9ACTN|nr:GNAT family N-acetyltransferase [Nocardioides marmoriginsengisoli]RNL64989.1 GNAT family N-acetyltransferase [Nocardioides marmoriginsengisoli]
MTPIESDADVLIRPGTAEDLAEIAELFIATRRDAVPQMPPVVSDDDAIRQWFADHCDTHEYWVAEDGEIIGFAMLDGAWLNSLYVGPPRQGSGIGSMLLDLIKAQRPDGFGLWVFASNASARGFYHRHGLVELEHTDGSANAERSPDVRMAWPGQDPIRYLRGRIDDVDDELALLLARRFALTATVQGYKSTPGQQGRDSARERAIAERMAAHAPGLGADAIARIMHAVISESLDAYESRGPR